MPVEVRELIIRASIVTGESSADDTNAGIEVDPSDLIADCVEQVLKILERRREP